jgi:hypothetical protein
MENIADCTFWCKGAFQAEFRRRRGAELQESRRVPPIQGGGDPIIFFDFGPINLSGGGGPSPR